MSCSTARPGHPGETPGTVARPLDCSPASPFCPPDWRWRLAAALRSGLLPRRRRLRDPRVAAAARLQAGLARPGRAEDRAVLAASRLRSEGDARRRLELEARVLAGQPAGAIAARLGLPADVVEAFEKLFFDVRDRLDAPDYIAAVAIGPALHRHGLVVDDAGTLLKVIGYGYGPHVLDVLMAVLDDGSGRGADAAEPGLSRLVRMAIAARALPAGGPGARGLLALHARLLADEREAADNAADAITGPVTATVGMALASPEPGHRSGPESLPKDGCGIVTRIDAGRVWEGVLDLLGPTAGAPTEYPGVERRTA